jgi:hypothetical protein
MNNFDVPSEEMEGFMKATYRRRLLYQWMLRFSGYKVDNNEIGDLEKKVYPSLNGLDAEGEPTISQRDLDELQLVLSTVDPQPQPKAGDSFTKAVLFRLHDITLRMRQEYNHQRPHFHIEYRKQYSASYAVDNLELLAGHIPTHYEKPILEWASRHQKSLQLTWEKLRAGENVQGLILDAKEEVV